MTGQLLKHLGGTGKSVTRLANADVEDELLDAELPHGVLSLLFGRLSHDDRQQVIPDTTELIAIAYHGAGFVSKSAVKET